MKLSLLVLLLSIPAAAFAADYGVEAAAVDSTGTPESFATWRVFAAGDSIRPVKGAVTGDDGKISTTLPHPGEYRIVLVGMSSQPAERTFSVDDAEPVARLGDIILNPASTELSEITVTAQRPLVSKEIDRIAYDVAADEESKTAQLTDILRKVPLVTVEPDGTVKVNGSSNFRVYKNGRPNNALTNNAKEIFKAIPASSIRKIEVITDPGAREDAEGVGAILNIITDNNTALKGVTGTVSVYANNYNLTPTPNVYVTTQVDRVTLSVNGGYWNSNRNESESFQSGEGTYLSTGNSLHSERLYYSNSNGGHGGLEASWEPDTMNLITVEANFFASSRKPQGFGKSSLTAADGSPIYSYSETTFSPKARTFAIDGAVNYQRNTRLKGETITLSYRVSGRNTANRESWLYSELVNPVFDYTGIESDGRQNFIEHTGQVDWSRPYGEHHKLDLGAKFIQRNNSSRNSRDYIGAGDTYDDFTHRTSIGAAYADYRVSFGRFNARAGLRYEFSHLSARYRSGEGRHWGSSLNDLAPNASVSWNVNDANTLKLSYNRRISRPSIDYLDPTVSETPQITSQGNPNLGSSAQDRISFNYNLIKPKIMLDVSAGVTFSNNQLMQTKEVRDQHTYYSYDNADHYRGVYISPYMQWSPGSKTQIMLNAYVSWQRFHSPAKGLTKCHWTYNPYVNITQKLPWKLTLRGWGGYWSGYADIYTINKPSANDIWYGLSLQRSFLRDDRLTVQLSSMNPFGPSQSLMRMYSINTDLDNEVEYRRMHNRTFSLSVSFRFGSLTASVRKTAASISNDDLQSSNSGGK
ncbi:MAG: TonB-dependent receptor [Muribaculaceae bacterium]|nr:TonB-dependent receptor [Muribaculaceae bacterium]